MAGQGLIRWKALLAAALRGILASAVGGKAIAASSASVARYGAHIHINVLVFGREEKAINPATVSPRNSHGDSVSINASATNTAIMASGP